MTNSPTFFFLYNVTHTFKVNAFRFIYNISFIHSNVVGKVKRRKMLVKCRGLVNRKILSSFFRHAFIILNFH